MTVHRLKPWQIFRFADKFDIFLMIIGTIAAILSGVLFPLMLFLYGKVINSLVQTKILQNVTTNYSNNSQCFVISDEKISSPYEIIDGIVNYFGVLGFVSIVCYWIAWSTWNLSAERQIRRIRSILFENILRQEIGWFDTHHTGELSHRLITDLDFIKDGINDKIADFLSLLSRILGSLIYALVVGWKLTLVYLSVLPLMIVTFHLIVKITVNYANKQIQAFALASSVAQEALTNIRTVTAFHAQANEQDKFSKYLILSKEIEIKKGVYVGICQGLVYLFLFVSYTLTFWYGPQLVRTDCTNYSSGSVMVIFVACMFATISIAYLTPNLQNFAEALTSGSYVFEIIDRVTKIDALSDQGLQPTSLQGEIQFENVTFAYPTRREISILNKLSIKIPLGKTVALVGASGCGKSTIIQLIQRFYDVDEGRILLDGQDIKTLNVAWLRSHIGIVSQESVLFKGSIEDNIRFGKPNATLDEIQAAAKMANAHDFIMKLPQKYKTLSGDKLSGGQKQRVAIARALISNPKILLLDEATSALDNVNERIVQHALDRARQGRTTIVIAHRLSTIENADLIIEIPQGQIIQYKTHQQLINNQQLTRFSIESSNCSDDDDDDDDDFEKEDEKPIDNHQSGSLTLKILKLNSREWIWIVLGGICSILFGTIQPLFALFLAQIVGLFAETNVDEQKRLVNIYAIAIFVVGLVGSISQICLSISFTKSGEELIMRLRKLTFAAILRQEINYFDSEANSIEILTTRLSTDISSLKNLSGIRIGTMLQALSAMITAVVIAFSTGWKLAFVVSCFAPLLILTGLFQGRKQNHLAKSKQNSSFIEQAEQSMIQAINHIRTVVGLHQEKYFLSLCQKAFQQEFKKQICRMHLTGLSAGIANSVTYFLYMATFSYGNQLVQHGQMEFSEVIRVLVAITFAMTSIGRAIGMLDGYSQAKQAAFRIMQIDQRQSQINPHQQSGIILEHVKGQLEFRDIHFRYPTRSKVTILENFSLKCESNCTTALVGPSGSGKSTVICLLQRFYDPLQGQIYLDGHDIKQFNIRWLRSLMGFVQQQPVIFNISIRDNITYGDQLFTQQQIEHAARMANIHDFIISLPQGYETLCGQKGNQLSGGQKQRIAIARALIRQPKIVLLDEATSSLDIENEQLVQLTLDQVTTNRTCLTIAHRLSTIQHSQNIAVLHQGKIKEQGTHQQLLQFNGIYAQLAQTQQNNSIVLTDK